MRISVDPQSPNWSPLSMHATVFVDGIKQTHCTLADDEQGYVERYSLGALGSPYFCGGMAVQESVRGQVDIIYPGMDFDAWMRDRTERAHADFMTRTAALSRIGREYARGGLVPDVQRLVGEGA